MTSFGARHRIRQAIRRSRAGWGAWFLTLLALAACGGGESKTASGDTAMQTAHAHTNRLIHEKSPYLLQHAHNPVDWYPWGPEALARAVKENKPIFLSIGYSTCHWCHVMEHESFENEEIAAFLNEHFVAIKVDREERPDLDALYMTAVQGMTGSGGWPMSVFLTPELKPFFAGTYFPPDDRGGRPGFLSLLHNIADVWGTDREALDTQADRVAEFLRAQNQTAPADSAEAALTPALLDSAFASVRGTFDARLGGFGGAPKFPTPHKLTFLLRMGARTGNPEALQMTEATLDAMAAGGIHDHLGGGFHRYATDAVWLVPHFEKMLYDQAGLALAYLAAYQVSGKAEYAMVVRDILDYVLRDLAHPEGGFYAAEDADSEGEEGTFYVWTGAAIDSVLGDGATAFRKAYRVTEMGNWEGKNILNLAAYTRETVEANATARARLFAVREGRPRPHRDEKILAGWNGFMIEAMARAGAVLEEPRYVEGAERAAAFVEAHLWKGDRLLRHYTGDGAAAVPAYLDDYAFLGRGYLELYETTFEPRWLERAVFLAREMDRLFARPEGGYLLAGSDGETLLAPVVESYDGAMPSGNSAAAAFLLRLGHLTGDAALQEKGWNVLRAFAGDMTRNPQAHLEMLSALDFALGPNTEIVIAGAREDAAIPAMLQTVRARYLPNAVLAYHAGDAADPVVKLIPYLEAQGALDGKPTAYVCRDYACLLPVHDAQGLVKQLDDR